MKIKFEKIYFGLILFAIGIIIYIFFFLMVCGHLFDLAPNYDSGKEFQEKYIQFWKDMTSKSRFVLTKTYYEFYRKLTGELKKIINKNKNGNIKFDIHEGNTNYYSSQKRIQHSYVPFIIVSATPNDKPNKDDITLVICSHFDGHNLTAGGTAYDDAINTVSMVGVLDLLANKDILINSKIDFVFDGGEEIDLIGARQYVDYLKENNRLNDKYDYLNLEAMGAGFPYVFIIRSKTGGYRVQSALLSTPGTIFLPFNFILEYTSITGSTTDHYIFDQYDWTGGVNVFVGKSSAYHTKYDRIESGKENDVNLAINQLITFISNYDPSVSNGFIEKSFCYGIAPVSIILPDLAVYIIAGVVGIGAIVAIILKERKNIKDFFFDLLKGFILFIIFLIFFIVQGLFVYLANPFSPGPNQVFVCLSALQGLCLLLVFQKIFKVKKFSRFRLVLDIIIMLFFGWTDFSILVSLVTLFSILFYAFDLVVTKMIFGSFQYLVCALYFAVSIQLFAQFSTKMDEFRGTLIIFLNYFLFAYHIVASPFEFYQLEIPESEEETSNNTGNQINTKELNTINDDYDNDSLNTNAFLNEVIKQKINEKKCDFKKILSAHFIFLILEILYILLLLLIFLLKPAPFSSDFLLVVNFMHIYDMSKGSSEMICIPYNQNRITYLQETYMENNKYSNIERKPLKEYEYGDEGDFLILEDKSAQFPDIFASNCYFPKKIYDYVEIEKDQNSLKFKIHIPKEHCINTVFIDMQKINGNKIIKLNNQEYNESDGNNYFKLRSGIEKISDFNLDQFSLVTSFTFEKEVDNLSFKINLESLEISNEYLSFQNNFGEGVSQFQLGSLSGTAFRYKCNYQNNSGKVKFECEQKENILI